MRVLLTGGFGYLASRMADSLTHAGLDVVLSGRSVPSAAAAWAKRFEVRRADVLEPETHAALLRGIDVLVHLASLDELEAEKVPSRAVEVSGEGTRLMLLAARAAGVKRTIFFSTLHVYGPTAPSTIDEETPTKAAHPYAIAHLTGEGYCRQAQARGEDVVVFRVSNGYGAPAWREVDRWTLAHNDFCRQAIEHKKIVLRSAGLQHRDFVAIDDIASATHLVAAAPRDAIGEGVFNVGGRLSLPIHEIARRVQASVEARLGVACPIERPAPPPGPPPTPVDYRIDRLSRLGYAPTDQLAVETDRLLDLLLR